MKKNVNVTVHDIQTASLDERSQREVNTLIGQYAYDLYPIPCSPTDQLVNVVKAYVQTHASVHLHFVGCTNGPFGRPMVAVAVNRKRQLIGAICYSAPAIKPVILLRYCVVAKDHRNKGVLRALMEKILSAFPAARLSCHPELVPVYERFGFTVTGMSGTEVTMETHEAAEYSSVEIPNPPEHIILNQESYLAAIVALRDTLSPFDYNNINANQLKARRLEQKRVHSFVESRLGRKIPLDPI